MSPNRWYNYAATYDGTTVTLYKNGAKVATRVQTFTSLSAQSTALGGWGAAQAAEGHWNGSLDQVRLYSTALTAEAIGKLYSQEAPKYKFAEK
jgi:hypothetical protein